MDAGIWTVGTAMGLINDIPTCGELVSRIVADAEELITGRLADMVDVSAKRERRVGDRARISGNERRINEGPEGGKLSDRVNALSASALPQTA